MVLRDENVAEGSVILHKEKVHNLYYSSPTPNMITSMESRRVRCAIEVEGTWYMNSAQKF